MVTAEQREPVYENGVFRAELFQRRDPARMRPAISVRRMRDPFRPRGWLVGAIPVSETQANAEPQRVARLSRACGGPPGVGQGVVYIRPDKRWGAALHRGEFYIVAVETRRLILPEEEYKLENLTPCEPLPYDEAVARLKRLWLGVTIGDYVVVRSYPVK
jgi:hypothetical protein